MFKSLTLNIKVQKIYNKERPNKNSFLTKKSFGPLKQQHTANVSLRLLFFAPLSKHSGKGFLELQRKISTHFRALHVGKIKGALLPSLSIMASDVL